MSTPGFAIRLAESGRIPDIAIRAGIRRLIRQRLREESRQPPLRRRSLMEELRQGPIASAPARANEQHHDLPPAFFEAMLGPRMKYSACYWSEDVTGLAQAEQAMLELIAERARLGGGLTVLDLGCGWGSFSLWAAERYPSSRIIAVSNSSGQKAYIDRRAAELDIRNLETYTADVNEFEPTAAIDRVVSVELFEHLQNYEMLLRRIANWLKPDGRLFVHVYCHRKLMYQFAEDGPGYWMGREFFAGGFMPASDTLPGFQADLRLERQWHLNGRHYRNTARAWLQNLDRNRVPATVALADASSGESPADVVRQIQRWRMFLMACEELFGFSNSTEWEVCHYLFAPRLETLGDDVPPSRDAP